MSSELPNQGGSRNELIFGNAPCDKSGQVETGKADERVDLEIILFGPKSRHLNNGVKLEPKRVYSTPYLKEFDPFARDKNAETASIGSYQSLKEESSRSIGSENRHKSSSSRGTQSDKNTRKYTTDPLLERMEKLYKDAGASSSRDDTHIDYMDYF